MHGKFSGGIHSTGPDSKIINSGKIETNGQKAYGIRSVGDRTTIENKGTIETNAGGGGPLDKTGSYGILSRGKDATIYNRGKISTKNKYSHGIYSERLGDKGAQNATINNSGHITASGNNAYAIKGEGRKEIVNLRSSSVINGAIDLGGGDDEVNVYSGSTTTGTIYLGTGADIIRVAKGAKIEGSIDFGMNDDDDFGDGDEDIFYAWSANHAQDLINFEIDEGIDKLIVDPTILAVVTGDEIKTIFTIDKTCQSVKGPVLSSLSNGLHGIIHKRLNHFKPELIKLATTRIEPGMLKTPDQPQAWSQAFSSFRKRDSDSSQVRAYDHKYRGFTGGFEKTYRRLRAGVMGGFSRANTEAVTFRTDSNSYFTGIYGQYDFGRIKLAASLIGGYEDHDNARYVTDGGNDETARADPGSFFLSPSVTVRADYTVAHRLLLRPMATVVYSAGWYDDYHEHGSTRSNLEIDDRTLQTLSGTLQISAIYMITDGCEFELSAGGNARYTDDGTVKGNIGGSDFRFTAANDDSVYAGQLGAYLSVNVNDQLNLYANAELSEASGDETRNFFMAGLKFSF